MADIAVVGGGVGGLMCAVRLTAKGHRVTIFERNVVVGGKLAVLEREGYRFDLGPSLLTLPDLFDEVFRAAGTTLADHVELVRLDPQFHYHWPDGGALVVHDDNARTESAFEGFCAGAGEQWRRFDARGRRVWDVAARTFFAGPMDHPLALARRMRSPRDLWDIDPVRTLAQAAGRTFDDRRLQQWASRYATYSGSSPLRAPATLVCIPHIEARFGCWYPMGGLDSLRAAIEQLARTVGVEIATGAEVTRIVTGTERVTGVELADGSRHTADVVVANVDAEHLYGDLLPDARALRRVRRADRSTSGFVICAGVRGATTGIGHHNVWFSADGPAEFRQLGQGRLAVDPTIYACVSSTTDPSQAPPRHENWFLLINTPAGIPVDADRATAHVLGRLAEHGVELRDRIEFVQTMTPSDIESRYRSPGGAIYGTSSNGRRAAFVRPANRGAVDGLYLVGGSSHPGGGLPLVTTSARIVADMIERDRR